MTTLNILLAIILVISSLYFIVIILILSGIVRLKQYKKTGNNPLSKISIIIPARNEEENIGNCLMDLFHQNYPHDQLEVVVVNDASTDRTEEMVNEFVTLHPGFHLKLIRNVPVGNDQAFKKHSIHAGITASSGNLIVTTDADTRSGPGWISSLAGFYEQYHPKMILGTVAFLEEKSFFERLQSLEFAGMIAATAGSCTMGFPLMCNGANLAFERSAYQNILNARDDFRFPSGDDQFLMMKIVKEHGAASVRFLLSEESIVFTKAKKTLAEFFSQRIRWVSKNRGYSDHKVSAVAIITYLFNLLSLVGLITGVFNRKVLLYALILLGIKMVLELPAVFRILLLTRRPGLLFLYPLTQLLNLFYVSVVGILGNVIPYKWKGRKINPVSRQSQA
ncbi:MAG: glycosyltransferase [Bacteroidetes bacterium]|nr:glycosyltransferase [Bacteroidota bacterium]